MTNTFTYLDAFGNIKTIRVLGHNILARRLKDNCEHMLIGEAKSGKGERLGELMLESLTDRNYTYLAEVLAVGRDIGKKRSPHFMRRFKYLPHEKQYRRGRRYRIDYNNACPIRVGDSIILPETSKNNLMWRPVTGGRYDVMVDESEVIAYIPSEGNQSHA